MRSQRAYNPPLDLDTGAVLLFLWWSCLQARRRSLNANPLRVLSFLGPQAMFEHYIKVYDIYT